MIRNFQETEEDAKKIREDMQYSSKIRLEDDGRKALMDNTKKFIEKMRGVLGEIKL